MKVSLRVILGVCFLIGALLFFCRGENHYALIFLLVGALYLYKGLSWGLNLVISFCISRIEWISLFSDINVTIFFFSKTIEWFYSLFRAKKVRKRRYLWTWLIIFLHSLYHTRKLWQYSLWFFVWLLFTLACLHFCI